MREGNAEAFGRGEEEERGEEARAGPGRHPLKEAQMQRGLREGIALPAPAGAAAAGYILLISVSIHICHLCVWHLLIQHLCNQYPSCVLYHSVDFQVHAFHL